ncbi:NAD(P)-dependent oxidoreductase [Sphingobium sp. Sx8-8]|uniref:NAD(P)-dependent oxidoreductase n=1 Tax=Sphingobium sp. Sx8-8 TaxID=2933617 RepID=UPI001F5AEBBD|nr:NAD(P)-dependent oxidoreductase [Sphingobium sp. Sx8-8]
MGIAANGKPRVLVTSEELVRLVRLPEDKYDISVLNVQPDRDAWLREHGVGIRAIVSSGMERLDAARLAMLPDLELIAVVAAGMAGIDLAAASARGIAVTNAGDLNSGDVADFAVTLMLAHVRDLKAADAYVRDGQWPHRRMPLGRSVASERVGIVGLGHIGRAAAERLAPFGCAIRWWGPRSKPDAPWERMESLDALAGWASTLLVAVAGSNETRGLVTAKTIEALGPDGLIVNVARGFVIDEPALKAALKEGRLRGAALDVVAREPDDGSGWADVPNLLLAPHIAGSTREAFDAVMASAGENVARLMAGEPLLRRVV